MAFDPWNNRGDEPARLAHLDDRDERGSWSKLAADLLKSFR